MSGHVHKPEYWVTIERDWDLAGRQRQQNTRLWFCLLQDWVLLRFVARVKEFSAG